MNNHDLVRAIASNERLPIGTVEKVFDGLKKVVKQNAANKEETVIGFSFLTVKTTDKPTRTGKNPRTGEAMEFAAKTAVKVSVGKALKDAANGIGQ